MNPPDPEASPRIYRNIRLDPFQERAVRAIERGDSVFVAAPTGAGKTLIAEFAIEHALLAGTRAIYTAPIKALSNQKFRDFTAAYPGRVGIKTGDVTIQPDAPVLLMTTEIFRNTLFENPEAFHDVRHAVFDEIHYLDDIERGTVWEESIIFAPRHMRVICLSATIPNVEDLAAWIRRVRSERVAVIQEAHRPVPLNQNFWIPGEGLQTLKDLRKREKRGDWPAWVRAKKKHHRGRGPRGGREPGPDVSWRPALVGHLADRDLLPAIYFVFNRRDTREFALAVRGPLLPRTEAEGLVAEFDGLCGMFGIREDAAASEMRGLLLKGVAYHHAGLLPTLKEVIERLFTTGRVRLLFTTETFAVGVNMPARTVVFHQIEKFDGTRTAPMKTREHSQMSGRAGRRGIDTVGHVYNVVPWPNLTAEEIERVVFGRIEPIRSQFNLQYSTILSLFGRMGELLFRVCEDSFANFTGHEGGRKFLDRRIQLVKKRLMLLRAFGYIEGEALTEKGKFARLMHGYELSVSEMLHRGILQHLSERELAALFCAVVFEAKRQDWFDKLQTPSFKWIRKASERAVRDVIEAELALGIDEITKPLDFAIAATAWAWADGCRFEELEDTTSCAPGDLVRCFRMAVQLVRQCADALAQGDPLRRRLRGVVDRINRDEVDAERQLRTGLD